MNILDQLQSLGAPLAAVIGQAILTWYRVREQGKRVDEHEKRLDDMEHFIYGGREGIGLAARVTNLEEES